MAADVFATRYVCDFCGRVERASNPEDRPEGWQLAWPNLRYPRPPVVAVFESADGRRWGDCCPACLLLPLRQLLDALAERISTL